MEKSKQKSLVIWVIAAVLVLAAAIGYRVISGGSGSGTTQGNEMFLVMCDKPGCGAVYEIEKTDYFKQTGANENSTLRQKQKKSRLKWNEKKQTALPFLCLLLV